MEWCHGKNIPTIHTLISDDDTLMKIKDDHTGDNYVDENYNVEDFAVCAAGIPALCGFWKQARVPVPPGALWQITGISCDEHTVSHEMHFVIFRSGHAPSFLMVSFCIQFLLNFFWTSMFVRSSIIQTFLLIDSFYLHSQIAYLAERMLALGFDRGSSWEFI